MYFYEIHCHTAETSRCGRSFARDMMAAYHSRGFAGVVVTDHFVNGYSYAAAPESWEAKMDAFMKGYHSARQAGEAWEMKVYLGLEFTNQGNNGEDYLVLGLNEEHLRRELAGCDQWAIQRLVDTVHALHGIVIRAHPYREADYIAQAGIERPGLAIDAVEVFNGGNAREIYNLRAQEMALREEKPFVAGSDSHHVSTVATDYIGFQEDPADYAALCAAIRQGKASLVHRPQR